MHNIDDVLEGRVGPLAGRTQFIDIVNKLERWIDNNKTFSWESKYNMVFSTEVRECINVTGIKVEYYDPDSTYENDVRAYMDALTSKRDELVKEG